MIIKQINITAFGGIRNKSLELFQGFNLIFGSNEAGKSTVQAFLKAMFYGINIQKQNIRENDRKRYMPWGLNEMSGNIIVQDDNMVDHVIIRSFGQTKRNDQCKVINAVSGDTSIEISNTAPGKDLFGLGCEAFEKTLFVKQLECKVSRGTEDEIMSKLSNIMQTGDEEVSFHKSEEALKQALKRITNTRKNGKLDLIKNRLSDLIQEREEIIKLNQQIIDEQIRLNNQTVLKIKLEKEIEEYCMKKVESCNMKLSNEYSKLHQYQATIKITYEKIENINNLLKVDDTIIDEDFVASVKNEYATYLDNKEQHRLLKNNRIFIGLIFVLGILWCTIGMMKIYSNMGYMGLMIIGIASIIYSTKMAFQRNKLIKKIKIQAEEIESITSKIQRNKQKIKIIGVKEEHYVGENNVLENSNHPRHRTQRCRESKKWASVVENIEWLITVLAKKRELENTIASTLEVYDHVLDGRDINKLKEQADVFAQGCKSSGQFIESEENINSKLDDLKNKMHEVDKNIFTLSSVINSKKSDKRMLDQIELDIENTKEKIGYYEFMIESIQQALEVLRVSFEDIRKNFGPKLNAVVGNIINIITSGKYRALKISDNYDIKIQDSDTNEIKELEYFSNGTWDQLYFALRLGIMDLIFERGKQMPILLDDVFVQYDDDRLKAVLEYLYNLSTLRQVVLFTCQGRYVEILKNYFGVNFIEI